MKRSKSIKEKLAEMVEKKLRDEFDVLVYAEARDFRTNKGAQPKNDICSWEATCGGRVQLHSYDRMTDLVRHGFVIKRLHQGMNIFELHQI